MTIKLLVFLFLAIGLTFAEDEIKSVDLLTTQSADLTPYEYAQLISEGQTEIIRKVVLHYLNAQIPEILKTRSSSFAKDQIRRWFSRDQIDRTAEKITEFMRARLFKKLQMEKLSDSFKQEIESHPEDYFLTFDMYDLLIDE